MEIDKNMMILLHNVAQIKADSEYLLYSPTPMDVEALLEYIDILALEINKLKKQISDGK